MADITPLDIVFALLQGIVALLLFMKIAPLPDFLTYVLGGGLILSAIYTLLV